MVADTRRAFMTDSIFDNLLPPPRELDAFVAAQVMGWQDVRWHPAQAVYVGTQPDDAVEIPVPQFTEREDLVDSVLTALQGLGHGVQITPVPEGWRVQVNEAAATLWSRPLALCASVWQAWHGAH
jgi:hypothetical protein